MSLNASHRGQKRRKPFASGGVLAALVLITLGVFASNGWLPTTDPLSGKKTGWFGKELPKNASSSWNPLAAPLPTPTPQLSKEYIYAGSRLLAVEDANATAAPPADLAIWRPSNGNWMVMGQPGSQQVTFQFGVFTDTPLIADYDGDGKTDFAVFRSAATAQFWIAPSDGSGVSGHNFGTTGDHPLVGDFDGDGKTDLAFARPNTTGHYLSWWIKSSSTGSVGVINYGTDTDIPLQADYDGDGRTDLAYYRPSNHTLYWINSATWTARVETMSLNGTKAVSSDYDGDGLADPALFDSVTATWNFHYSTGGSATIQWGAAGDVPVQNDYDGDGKTDLAVWHNATGVWSIKKSSDGTTRSETFGQPGDIPVPAYYRR